MVHYIINTVAFQLFFLIIYDLFLKKETFFNWNRAYLLVTSILSLVIPFIEINHFKEIIPPGYIISLPEAIIGNVSQTDANTLQLDPVLITTKPVWSWELVLYIGMLLAALLLLFKITKLILIVSKNPKTKRGHLFIVRLLNSYAAFSCFHYIFLGEQINEKDKASILKHEMVHVKQKHTLDLLFFEVLRILFWFSPLVYMYQNRMMQLHEFIADKKASKNQSKTDYYENLLSQVFQTKNISFINPFFKQSLIKKRIVMLQKSQSKQINLLKYVLLIPTIFAMMVYTSTQAQKSDKNKTEVSDGTALQEVDIEVPFAVVEQVPVFPGCEDLSREEQKDCISKSIAKHVNRNFNTELATQLGLIGRQRINVIFKIDTDGNIGEVRSRAPHPKLEEEAIRVIKTLPRMIPGKQKGKTVVVPYSLPIIFQVQDRSVVDETLVAAHKEVSAKDEPLENIEVPFGVIDQVPIFPGCDSLSSRFEKRNCTSGNIQEFVAKNFNTKLATDLGLTGRQRINVIFKIDTEGHITGVRSRASHPKLEEEAIRVISALPKMIPGKQKGNKVTVPYSLPIIFEVEDDIQMLDEVAVVGYADDTLNGSAVPFGTLDKVPTFGVCKSVSQDEQRTCVSYEIQKHVNQNFNTNLAKSLGLKGQQRINIVFKITKEGHIEIEQSRAPHLVLEEEAIRVIKTLPKMTPGEHKGEKVDALYSLPIIFKVAD
ncbi:energy transducer TonB [Flavivirga sp. 57AJ16]|uniref:energy transducer TonB n=1 Tax=Flavivirga sp. 57AJ16 TaxID=3025307 RepID=UPI0023652071|nr:energy transducer TonB [Flavivirga sp. 57AJ16]MDD7886823.1 energy transducer TonB [Flavivirga sp. 57AJ16]